MFAGGVGALGGNGAGAGAGAPALPVDMRDMAEPRVHGGTAAYCCRRLRMVFLLYGTLWLALGMFHFVGRSKSGTSSGVVLASVLATGLLMAWCLMCALAIRNRMAAVALGGPDDPRRRNHLVRRLRGRHGMLSMPHLALMMQDRDFGSEDYEVLLALDENTPTQMLHAADASEIDRLPVYTFKAPPQASAPASGAAASSSVPSDAAAGASTKPDGPPRSCSVCLEEFQDGESLRILPCLHSHHVECIDKWLVLNATCPVCKASIR